MFLSESRAYFNRQFQALFSICEWLTLLIAVLIFGVLLGVFSDGGVSVSWSNAGGTWKNDRHLLVSSVHSKIDFFAGEQINFSSTSPVLGGPVLWNGNVFYLLRNGSIVAADGNSGEISWSKNFCVDYYRFSKISCRTLISANLYVSVATPSVWGSNLVILIKKPADILVVEQNTGKLLSRKGVSEDPLVQLSQSGTVWDDSLYFGTDLSDSELPENANVCSFVGKLYRWDLVHQIPMWITHMDDPMKVRNVDKYSGNRSENFSGMALSGSSPALHVDSGLVSVAVGPLTCSPAWYRECLTPKRCEDDDDGTFDVRKYRTEYRRCHSFGDADRAVFNSVAVFSMKDGSLYWKEKLIGHRAWSAACSESLQSGRNEKNVDFTNCPTERESSCVDYEFVNDPSLKLSAKYGNMVLAMQKNGAVFAFELERYVPNLPNSLKPIIFRSKKMLWATWTFNGLIGSGFSVNKNSLIFSASNYFGKKWFYPKSTAHGFCGGWGSLDLGTGFPNWYAFHPNCTDETQIVGDPTEISRWSLGIPTTTNDVTFVASGRRDRSIGLRKYDYSAKLPQFSNGTNGTLYAIDSKTGEIIKSLEVASAFDGQSVSIQGRCFYVGSGQVRLKPRQNNLLLGWCAKR